MSTNVLRLPSFENLPTREEVLDRLFALWRPELPAEIVAVEDALGRVTAEDCRARISLPVVRASAGDGIAVDSRRFRDGLPDTSDWQMGRDFVRADTGDDFDDRFDAVVMIEDVELDGDGQLRIRSGVTVRRGSNVHPSGSIVTEGELLVARHMPLRPRDLACLHLGGVWDVPVLKRPAVAFIPTGNELVPPRSAVPRGKNVDSNSVLARTSLQLLGAEPLLYPIVPDDRTMLNAALDDALGRADIVILNGGSSKGGEDHNARLLHERGTVLCHGAAAAPGKPLCAAMVDGKPIVNLPGPFIAAYHGFEWCIGALVSYCLHQPKPEHRPLEVTLSGGLPSSDQVSLLCNLDVRRGEDGGYVAHPIDFRRSSAARTASANAQYMTPPGGPVPSADSKLVVELLREAGSIARDPTVGNVLEKGRSPFSR
ncbi:molybdopterin molybdotransferase MoeA [Fretibacterium sp. OH1220_COT-178]|uniref:molybdopterin molybdotransferase MoeA n=1 Tax=Fretibacterium sp. OH1220_COT-178 TaxID=2491047 RepID=UPI000F5DABCA|nr:molybdopterin molybdotransferase MoeA [Fretibacterium sp. OH1220_COT-178]RRD66230.1 molybdopterin molybdenumtransferase MoeA [Fretibacterium sp. OH1220_COT-178]